MTSIQMVPVPESSPARGAWLVRSISERTWPSLAVAHDAGLRGVHADDRGLFVFPHESAVTFDICTQDRGQFALARFSVIGAPVITKSLRVETIIHWRLKSHHALEI